MGFLGAGGFYGQKKGNDYLKRGSTQGGRKPARPESLLQGDRKKKKTSTLLGSTCVFTVGTHYGKERGKSE